MSDKRLKDFKAGNQFVAENGATFGSLETFVLEGLMGFCGCGRPDLANEVIFNALRHIEDLEQIRNRCSNKPGSDPAWTEELKTWNAKGVELFGSVGMETLVYYVLDKAELTEHGGSVPGWLTPLGEDVLAELSK